ncbi:MAG: Ig-like domain repeat protein [Candidatus Bathyarchaeia archaeon]
MRKGQLKWILLGAFLLSLTHSIIVKAQPYYDAYFTSIKVTHGNADIELISGGTAKVYDGQLVWINLTYYNERCGVFGANLYTKVYENDVLLATSSEAYVLKGTYYGNQFYTYLFGPGIFNYKVELWWDSSGTHYLEDVNYFSINVVKLYVADWSPSSLSVEKGKATASTWSITFKNGGNDMMYNTSISIVDSSGLQISPMSANLGDISSQGTKSTSFSVVAPSTISTGSKTVSFRISYDDFRGDSHEESKIAYISVIKLSTSITLTINPSNVKIGGSITVTAKLLDGNGNPIPDQAINFFIGTTSLGTTNTDSSGNAIKSYTANVDAGTYVINASFAGSADFGSSSGTTNLIVNPFTTTLTLEVPSATQGKAVTIKATLKDENNNPVQGANIQFQIYDGTTWSDIGSSTTDANGVASISYTPSNIGTFQVRALFSGTTNYSQSTSLTGSLNVGMDYTPYYILIIAIVIVICGAVGYVVYRKRRKPVESTSE